MIIRDLAEAKHVGEWSISVKRFGLFLGDHNKAERLYEGLVTCLGMFGILEPVNVSHFIGQTAHETGNYRWNRELWGPTDQQKRYEGTTLATRLGNTEPGDGFRFRGRGWIHVTGRYNYAQISRDLGIDFVSNPDLLADDFYAPISAGWYWHTRNINDLCVDVSLETIRKVTRVINGGFNGIDDRIEKTQRMYGAFESN